MLILTFEDDEEKVLRKILTITDSGLNTFQYVCNMEDVLSFRGLEIDVPKRVVYRGRQEVKITFIEFEILYLLAGNPGKVFSKEQIYDIV